MMRALTTDELREVTAGALPTRFLAHTNDVSTVTVTGPKLDPSHGGGGSPGGGGDGSGGGGGGIGGGGGGGGLGPGGVHTSPGGHSYVVHVTLNGTQVQNIDRIIDYGSAHGKTQAQINIVVNQAFNESSLNTILNNSTHFGEFQYSQSTWDGTHPDLNINSTDDQISAMFQDLDVYAGRYATGEANGSIPTTLSFADYVEVKHHIGASGTDWTSPFIAQYESSAATLGYTPS